MPYNGYRLTHMAFSKMDRKNNCLKAKVKMTKFTLGQKCPYCKDIKKFRIKRRTWMRLIPWTKYYHCGWCGCSFFTFLNGIAVRLF